MKKLFSIIGLLLILSGCASEEPTDKVQIMTTYYPYQLVTEEIGGEFVDVSSIYPPDSDAHSYELTPRQTMDLQDADLVIITNQEEDSKIYRSLEDKDNLLVLEEAHANPDDNHYHSHGWLSPLEMEDAVTKISNSLIDLDPMNKAAYSQASSTLQANLQTISSDYEQFGASQTKPIVATHDAYSALTEDYGIEFVTLYGQHHDDEPTTKDIISTVDLIEADDINTIFVEQDDVSNSVMRQIADEASVDVETLFTLETESSIQSFDSIIDFYQYNLQMFEKGQE